MTLVDSNLIFCVAVHMGLNPLLPVHVRPLEPDPPPCGRHNGWPLTENERMSQVRQGCNIYDMTFTCQGYCEKSAIGNPNQSSGHAGIILIYLSLLLDCKRAQRFSSPRHQVTICISINVSGRSRF